MTPTTRLPAGLRLRARTLRLILMDGIDVILNRRHPLVPPRREIHKIGGHDFLEVGRHLAELAQELGRLKPHERLLDVGCGIGRLAVGLLDHLEGGEYAGFDIDRSGIAWCRRAIESRFPNFHFTLVDVRNGHYNPRGAIPPEKFVFPYASDSMDVVFASSVFTHLTPAAGERYLSEASRVLKAGGRFVSSFFLLNDESRAVVFKAEPRFNVTESFYAVQDTEDIEAAIAFDEAVVTDAISRHGLCLDSIAYGAWAYREKARSFQDFLVARK